MARQPWESRINYFAPCGRAAQRLRPYGVPGGEDCPDGLPAARTELLGDNLATLKHDLARRLGAARPGAEIQALHAPSVKHFLDVDLRDDEGGGPSTITYAVGWGAQKEIGGRIVESLRARLERGEVRLNLVAGIRDEVDDLLPGTSSASPSTASAVTVHHAPTIPEYFERFNAPAEDAPTFSGRNRASFSFYCALGIPIIMTPHDRLAGEIQPSVAVRSAGRDETGKPGLHRPLALGSRYAIGRMAEMAWDGFLKAKARHAEDRRGADDGPSHAGAIRPSNGDRPRRQGRGSSAAQEIERA